VSSCAWSWSWASWSWSWSWSSWSWWWSTANQRKNVLTVTLCDGLSWRVGLYIR
jgi:hypothetical protein